ncbi:hypothetical protein [Streptomyces sp. PT12]|uniref:hypothetical protein n=1 Tax=Streptomyces sp. PT12 TaxID=1510197 RepID=UPI000DE2F56D|nr:hypothetical protein [Streptomyces sp. PT12]RBM11769.1 hypothetical protein DEH69_20980 [Streptomyces sp. PT12]
MVSALLGVALTLFVFAQAAVTRSAGQSAADAAALAAAQESRDELFDAFFDAIGEDGETDPGDILDGDGFETGSACDAAARLADRNDAVVRDCGPAADGIGFTVVVETRDTVGESLIPGTESQTARAEATAVIAGACELRTDEDERVELECEDGPGWIFDPGEEDPDEDERPDARDLFEIHLED